MGALEFFLLFQFYALVVLLHDHLKFTYASTYGCSGMLHHNPLAWSLLVDGAPATESCHGVCSGNGTPVRRDSLLISSEKSSERICAMP